jgi:CheY-like chemotaxis protein
LILEIASFVSGKIIWATDALQPKLPQRVWSRSGELGLTSKGVILVVEDEPLIRLNTVDTLEAAGYEVAEAGNADAAIKILEARPDIRLVFTDVAMPGSMDGLKLAHYVRDRWPPIHLIVTSGHLVVEEAALPMGAKFFGKPYLDRDISQAIRTMLTSDIG